MESKGKRIKKKVSYKGMALLSVLFLFSCSQVKFVPQNKYLLNKVDIEIDNPEIEKDDAKSHIRQKENYKILGFAKFHLMLYNLSSKKNTDDWLKRIGEPPQVYDELLLSRSQNQLIQYLNNKGYFRATVNTDVELKEKKRKVQLKYQIKTGEQYKVRKINYHIPDSSLHLLLLNDSAKSKIKPGSAFDFYLLDQQRERLVDLFRNEGYFYFSKDDIKYLADTTKFSKEVVLDLYVGDSIQKQDEMAKTFRPYFLNNFHISVLPGTAPVSANINLKSTFSDTVSWDNFLLYRSSKIRYNPILFQRAIKFGKGDLFSSNAVENTFTAFNRLRQFRFIDIKFDEPKLYPNENLLDCYIRLAPLNKQSTSFDIEGTNTSGNLGVAGNINYEHRNLFKGAEVFQIQFKGAMERQQRIGKNDIPEYFNTRELGIESKLIIPKLLGPGFFINAFDQYLPKTVVTLGYNFQRRPEYTRTISGIKYGYDWMTSEYLRHTWNLVDFNMVNLYKFDPGFINLIQDLYIKSSFTDHLIFAMNYSFVYNTQKVGTKQNYTYLKFNAESAGNVLSLVSSVFNQSKYQVIDTLGVNIANYYRAFNTRYAQYVKSDIEFRYGYIIDKYNSIVTRGFVGAGLPYGNFDVLPFEKKYFTGGANGIRAWQVRSLGPGTYEVPTGAYPNQSSDIKIEANIEYRFKLIGFLEAALFLDAGNIWAINEKDNREGAQFEFNKFYKQFAIGTGTGFRFDFSYFVFRLDLGMKLRNPSQPIGNGWIVGTRPYKADDFALSFAIGYPF